jgi:hypothetical protein
VLPTLNKLGNWILKQSATFVENMVPAAGKALGEKTPYLLVAAAAWHYGVKVSELIESLLKHL